MNEEQEIYTNPAFPGIAMTMSKAIEIDIRDFHYDVEQFFQKIHEEIALNERPVPSK